MSTALPLPDWTVTVLDLQVTCRSGLRIAGPSDRDDVDIAVHRDHRGEPLVPGSSLKGVLRSLAERILSARDPALACDILATPCLGRPGSDADVVVDLSELESLCWCCGLFGSPHRAGRLVVGDLCCDRGDTVVRDGVGIDRNELRAADKVKFDYEVVVPGTTFRGELRIEDATDVDLGLVVGLLELLGDGLAGLGGGITRGLGRIGVEVVGVREIRASTWRPGQGFEAVGEHRLAAARSAAVEFLDESATGGSDG